MHMDMEMNSAIWAMMGLGSFSFLLFWSAIIGLAVWAVHRFAPQRSDAMKILEERYARGELNSEEFLRMKEELTS